MFFAFLSDSIGPEDISPYATFQLSEASTLAQPHPGPANTLLHSFMYHERALQEGCASPPPAVLSQHNSKSSHYYNIVRFLSIGYSCSEFHCLFSLLDLPSEQKTRKIQLFFRQTIV